MVLLSSEGGTGNNVAGVLLIRAFNCDQDNYRANSITNN